MAILPSTAIPELLIISSSAQGSGLPGGRADPGWVASGYGYSGIAIAVPSQGLSLGIARTEMLQYDERICGTRVYDLDAFPGRCGRDEKLILREFTETNHGRR